MQFSEIVALSEFMEWEWTPAQAKILKNLTRYILLCGGRRGGKSLFTNRWMGIQIVDTLEKWEDSGKPRVEGGIIPFWLVGKSYEASEQEYNYLAADLTARYGESVEVTRRAVGPNEITVHAAPGLDFIIRTKSAADEGTLEMEAPAAIAVCEAAQISYSAYLRLLGRITERRAPLLLSGSLEEDFGFYNDLLTDWSNERVWKEEDSRSWVIESQTNTFAFPEGENDPELQKRKRELSEDDFNRMFMGRSAPARGLVHPTFRTTTHVQDVPYIPGEDVWLAVDPGIAGLQVGGSAYAVNFCHTVRVQEIHDQMRVFDSIYVDNMDEDTIIEAAMNRPWWGKSDIYGVIDRQAAARTAMKESATSRNTWFRLSGLRLRYTKAAIPLRDHRQRFNAMLKVNDITKEPGLVMDARKTKGLQSELGGCANPIRPDVSDQVYRWNIDTDGAAMGKDPRNKYCDAIKALYYLAWDRFGSVTPRNAKKKTGTRRHRTLRRPIQVA